MKQGLNILVLHILNKILFEYLWKNYSILSIKGDCWKCVAQMCFILWDLQIINQMKPERDKVHLWALNITETHFAPSLRRKVQEWASGPEKAEGMACHGSHPLIKGRRYCELHRFTSNFVLISDLLVFSLWIKIKVEAISYVDQTWKSVQNFTFFKFI